MTHNPIRAVLAEAAQGNVPDDDTLRAAVGRYRSVSDRTAGARQLRIHAKRIAAAASAGLPGEVEKLTEAAVHALAQYGSGAERDSLPPRERDDTSRRRGPGISQAESALRDMLHGASRGGVNLASKDVKRLLDLVDGDRDAFRDALRQA